jgi:hypothetical protein
MIILEEMVKSYHTLQILNFKFSEPTVNNNYQYSYQNQNMSDDFSNAKQFFYDYENLE